jgi:hypothetical protein
MPDYYKLYPTWGLSRYFAIDQESYDSPLSEDDYQYNWAWFQEVRDLYEMVARDGRCVLFTTDQ